jgi:hypothetical protein
MTARAAAVRAAVAIAVLTAALAAGPAAAQITGQQPSAAQCSLDYTSCITSCAVRTLPPGCVQTTTPGPGASFEVNRRCPNAPEGSACRSNCADIRTICLDAAQSRRIVQ